MKHRKSGHSVQKANTKPKIITKAKQLSSSTRRQKSAAVLRLASNVASNYQSVKKGLQLAKALDYTFNYGITYKFLDPIVEAVDENDKNLLVLLCELPLNEGPLRDMILCFLANILKKFWLKDTHNIV